VCSGSRAADDESDAMTPTLPTPPHDFGFGEDHQLLRQSARRFVSERFDAAQLRRFVDAAQRAEPGHDEALQREIAALGWTVLTVPASAGGSGLGWLHAALLAEELGRALLPLPIIDSMLTADALHWGDQPSHVAAIATGEVAGTFALTQDHGRYGSDAIDALARPQGDDFQLTGSFAAVSSACRAGLLLAPFALPAGELTWFAIPLPHEGVGVEADRTLDPTRPTARVGIDATVPAGARLSCPGERLYRALHMRAALLLAAGSVGAAETALSMTRDYACEREQFGRPIGTYQAVSHPIVDTMLAIERARSLYVAAAAALDSEVEADAIETLTRMANCAASEALWQTTSRGVQLHGGFGFTWECDMHFYFRRALYARGALGDPHTQRQALAAQLLGD